MPPPYRILVVEDDAFTRDAMAALLRDDGYDVVTARDGLDALGAVKREQPDLIITDDRMPRMDGRSLVERLRRDPATHRVPIIFVSAYAPPPRLGTEDGADEYFVKPVDVAELVACVCAQLVNRSR